MKTETSTINEAEELGVHRSSDGEAECEDGEFSQDLEMGILF